MVASLVSFDYMRLPHKLPGTNSYFVCWNVLLWWIFCQWTEYSCVYHLHNKAATSLNFLFKVCPVHLQQAPSFRSSLIICDRVLGLIFNLHDKLFCFLTTNSVSVCVNRLCRGQPNLCWLLTEEVSINLLILRYTNSRLIPNFWRLLKMEEDSIPTLQSQQYWLTPHSHTYFIVILNFWLKFYCI